MLKMNMSNEPTEQGGSFHALGSRIKEELMAEGFALCGGFMPGTSVQTQKCRP
jgi:hypothetical protein